MSLGRHARADGHADERNAGARFFTPRTAWAQVNCSGSAQSCRTEIGRHARNCSGGCHKAIYVYEKFQTNMTPWYEKYVPEGVRRRPEKRG